MDKNNKIHILSPQTIDYTNYVVTVPTDGHVIAEVANKEQYTKEELDSVRWVAQMINKTEPNFTREHLSAKGAKINLLFPKIFAGGGYAWLEAVFGDSQPTNKLPNGFFFIFRRSESDCKNRMARICKKE